MCPMAQQGQMMMMMMMNTKRKAHFSILLIDFLRVIFNGEWLTIIS